MIKTMQPFNKLEFIMRENTKRTDILFLLLSVQTELLDFKNCSIDDVSTSYSRLRILPISLMVTMIIVEEDE